MSFISKALEVLPVVGPITQAITQGGPRRQYKWNKKASEDANVMNRANQQWLLEQNQALQAEQRAYDDPKAQRARYIAAGLNPNIIYGSGSSAGQAFPIDAGSVPGVNIQPPSARYPDIAGSFMAAGQISAQTQLAQARTEETLTNQALKSIQIDIAKTNPMLNPDVANWVMTSIAESARLKTMESRTWLSSNEQVMKVTQKINMEIAAMAQKLGLNTADLAIKNRILESKEFENAVKEINMRWMRDNEITPQLMFQGGMQILKQLLGAGLKP